MKQHFVPSCNYQFPSHLFHGHCRHFQQRWLEQYNGLVHSESEDHQAALEAATAFTATMENPEVAVDHRLSSERSKHAAENQLNFLTTVGYLLEVFIRLWIPSLVRISTSVWS